MLIVGILLAVIGALLIVAYVRSKTKCIAPVQAAVVRLAVTKFPLRGTTVKKYAPVFTYSVDGKEYSGKADITTFKSDKYRIGQQYTVFIDPEDPGVFRFGNIIGFLLVGILFALAGALMIVLFFM